MALVKQTVPIAFAQGLDTKTDPKHVLPGRLLELENGVFTKFGAINKRNGHTVLGTSIIGGGDLTEGAALGVFKKELGLFTGKEMYSYSEANNAWANKGRIVSIITTDRKVIRNSAQQTVPVVATNEGITLYAWEDTRGGVRISVLDQETGNYLISDEEISSTGTRPKAVSLNRSIYIFYMESTVIKFKKVNVSEPSTISSSTEFATNVDGTDSHYDVIVAGSRIFAAWNNDDASTAISVKYVTSAGLFSVEHEYSGEEASGAVTLFNDSSDNIWVAYSNGTEVKCLIRDYSLENAVLAPTLVETVSDVENITGLVQTTTATLYYQINAANTYDHYVRTNTVTLAGTAGTAALFKRSVGLGSKCFEYNSEKYVVLAYDSALQATYFLANEDGDILAKISSNLGGGLTAKSILPEVPEYSTGVFIFVGLIKGKLQAESGTLFTRLGVNSTLLDFVSNNQFQSAELGDNLHLVGGLLHAYDGDRVTEHGFNLFPENIAATPGTSGGNMADGTYLYSVIFKWTDNYGQIHRSAPSIPLSVTVSGGSGSGKVDLTIPTLRLTRKTDVNIEVYRTEAGGSTIFYRLNSLSSPLANSTTSDSVSYEDTVEDADIISNEILYTTGGVVDNIAAPACSLIASYNNRLIINTPEPNVLLISKERREGDPVQFTDDGSFYLRVESKGGDPGAFGVLDDKFIIFKKNIGIYWTTGNGPTDAGADNDLIDPQALPTDAACDNPNSVVITPAGLMFQTPEKGLYLLDRSLQTSYIGAPVESYNNLTITGASLVPNTNQVRFTTNAGSALVYDYLFNQWSTFTNHEGEDNVIWDNRFVFLRSNGEVLKENPGSYVDGTVAVKLRLVTSWLSLAGIQGFQRVYRLLILGDYKSSHQLILRVGYNFNEYFTQEVTLDPGTMLETATYGEDTPYGSGEVYGGEYRLYQFRIHLTQQKCQSIRFSIEDFQSENFGEGFSISGFGLEVGGKKGLFKKDSTRSFGTEG